MPYNQLTIQKSCVNRCGHNRQISIAKAIGIILMVTGHSGCPEYLHDFIYLFHMPLFYFLSAYFFRDEKVTKNCGQYVMRKFKNLYWHTLSGASSFSCCTMCSTMSAFMIAVCRGRRFMSMQGALSWEVGKVRECLVPIGF